MRFNAAFCLILSVDENVDNSAFSTTVFFTMCKELKMCVECYKLCGKLLLIYVLYNVINGGFKSNILFKLILDFLKGINNG